MKVFIGPYTRWYSTRSLDQWYSQFRFKKHDWDVKESDMNLFDRFVYKSFDGLQIILSATINKFNTWRGRKVKVRIDSYDTWNMDDALAAIILPMLKQLKATKHGAPHVDDADVPEELRSTSAPAKENDWDIDDNHFKRWDWVMDEMIWAFEQLNHEGDGEDQFYTGESDTLLQALDKDTNPIGQPMRLGDKAKVDGAEYYSIVDGPNHTRKCDYEGLEKHYNRIKNGTTLFGKYYQGLWD